MIEVTVGTTTSREKGMYAPTATLKSILEDKGVDYGSASIMLDGAPVQVGGLNKTLADYNVTEKCMLVAVVKTQNA